MRHSSYQMLQISQEGKCWQLSGNILMQTAGELVGTSKQYPMLPDMIIDFAQVKEVDTAAISLMMEWQRVAKDAGVRVTFLNLPENLLSLTKLYGVEAFIPLTL